MDIVRFFGRAFAKPDSDTSKDPPSPTTELRIEEEIKVTQAHSSGNLSDNQVVLRRGKVNRSADVKSEVIVDSATKKTYRFSQSIDSEIKKSHRVSLADFSVGVEVEEEKKYPVQDEEGAIPEEISGTDWESVCYQVDKIKIGDEEEEVTAIDVSEHFIALQFHIDPEIHIFDRKTKALAFKLLGHGFGGQCLKLSGDILYSGSMDKTVRSWNLSSVSNIETIYNHVDYVQCIGVLPNRWCASGGRGDKAIFVYETDAAGKLWRRFRFDGHEGWINHLVFIDESTLVSGSEDADIRIWDLRRGTLLRVLPQDEGVSCLTVAGPDLLLFGDRSGKLSYLDLETRETIHLLPNILVSTGCYCRSSKYHDKAVDNLYWTGNGYMITASAGSKYIKVWRVSPGRDKTNHHDTEVKEIQILREHSSFLTALSVHNNIIFSTSSDGYIYIHEFPRGIPHYEMAVEQENASAAVWNKGLATPEHATEICPGPRLCRVGKVGIVRSSSSFQVKFQLKPKVCSTQATFVLPRSASRRMPPTLAEEIEASEEEESLAESDILLSTSEESDSESDEE